MALQFTSINYSLLGYNKVQFILQWTGGTSPYIVEIETGDGEVEYQENILTSAYVITHTYQNSGTYEVVFCVYCLGDGTCASGYITVLPTIKEMIYWQGDVVSGSHTFYLLSLYGINTNGTIAGFQTYHGTYKTAIIYSPGQSRQDELTTSNVSQYDCLTIIAENFDGSNITGIYDARIQNNVT